MEAIGGGRDRMLLCLAFLIIDSLGRCTFFPRCLAIIAFFYFFPFSFLVWKASMFVAPGAGCSLLYFSLFAG